MQRILAACLVALVLVGCSQAAPREELADGACNGTMVDLVKNHISGQIDALTDNDWELAYSFASKDFQASVSIDDFVLIIGTQYEMLIENNGYVFSECTVAGSSITQGVKILSAEGEDFLTYTLTLSGSTLGVESAVVSRSSEQVDAGFDA